MTTQLRSLNQSKTSLFQEKARSKNLFLLPIMTTVVLMFHVDGFTQGTWTPIATSSPHTNGGGMLLLSDGKPNDSDEYDGRYGVEDMRQSIIEARLQGIFPFCLTIDRHTASYLPAVFGEHQYAVLHRPELLPTALLGWLRRLVQR